MFSVGLEAHRPQPESKRQMLGKVTSLALSGTVDRFAEAEAEAPRAARCEIKWRSYFVRVWSPEASEW